MAEMMRLIICVGGAGDRCVICARWIAREECVWNVQLGVLDKTDREHEELIKNWIMLHFYSGDRNDQISLLEYYSHKHYHEYYAFHSG